MMGGENMGSLNPGVANRVSPSHGSDASVGIANILRDVGPSCTRNAMTFRDTLAEITNIANVDEAALARIIFFLSDKGRESDGSSTSSLVGVSSALLGSLIPGRGMDGATDGWNLKSVAQVFEEDFANRDWIAVATGWDFPGFALKDTEQFRTLVELYRAGAKRIPPLAAFTSTWRNQAGQLSVLESMVAVSQSIYVCPLNEDERADLAAAGQASSSIDPQCFASADILQRLLFISDNPSLYRRVRDLFVKGLLGCPEVLLCSLVRLQLTVANSPAQPGRENLSSAGMQIKMELMRELIPLFFRPNTHHRVQNAAGALHRLYSISPNTVTAACFEGWRSTVQDSPQLRLATLMHIINIARLLPSPAEAIASLLNGNKDPEFSIAIAFVMADNDYLQLKPWLVEKLSQKASASTFAAAIISYLAKTYTSAAPRGGGTDGKSAPLVSVENLAISLQILQALDQSTMAQPFPTGEGAQPSGTTIGDNFKAVAEACIGAFPSLRGTVPPQPANPAGAGGGSRGSHTPSPGASDDVEEMATAYFQKIYTSEQSIGEVVEMLKRFKTSGNAKENEIFACMVHNLFDEYRFFSKYPEKELRITGILFGTLIQEQLVSSITLGIALRYVLEALRKPPSPPGGTTSSSGKMFKFGMFALEQFKGRLHEWPQYCSHIVQIPHLKDGYARLVAEIESAMSESQNRGPSVPASVTAPQTPSATIPSNPPSPKEQMSTPGFGPSHDAGRTAGTPASVNAAAPRVELSAPSTPAAPPIPAGPPRVAEFGPKLGRAVTQGDDDDKEHEAPPDAVLDRVQFLVNNLAPSNVEMKAQELKDLLEPKYFGWLGHFLVVKRISTQANYHSLYLNLLDQLGEYGKGLVEAILDSVYHNIGKLLRSPKITTSSSERSYLKNLGIWLGQITLSRNRPILQIMLDCKELLLQGYETGKLIAVAPFLAKTLEGAKNSIIFRPPNPWLMGLLGVFRSVYNVEGLKMNIKFEVEVLCKNLGIKLEDIPLKTMELARRVAPVKEKNPDFNIKSTQKAITAMGTPVAAGGPMLATPDAKALGLPASEDGGRGSSGDQQETVIPNLAAYVTVNPSLTQLLQQSSQGGGSVLASLTSASLKRAVPIAVDRAIREIIQPVVERSVTIACITTKEIVTKDFAMESDENKMRKAGQLTVANLAGSLALVTCREPLRSSVSTHLRQLLTSSAGGTDKLTEQEQSVIEQCVQICATDNLELGCMLIEKAATEKAVRDVDEALAQPINARRKHREQTGQPFYDMSIFGNVNQRYPGALPDQLRPKPGGLRAAHIQLYDSFQRMPRQPPAPGANGLAPQARSAVGSPGSATDESKVDTSQQFGTDALSTLAAKLDNAVSALLNVAGPRAPEIKLPMLPPDHQIRQLLAAVKQVMPNMNPSGVVSRALTQHEQEAVLGFSQGIFKRLYELSLTEPLRLEALVALLESVNVACPKLGKDIGTWATYAPTNTETQRRLHRTVLLLLVRSRLLAVNELDGFLAARADNGRNHLWVEFSLLFIRTAFLERISLPADFPKLIDLMTRVAEGRSQANPQVVQAYRKPILRMLEETQSLSAPVEQQPAVPAVPVGAGQDATPRRSPSAGAQQGSSLSMTSLSKLAQAPKKVAESTDLFMKSDPPNARQQVTTLLDNFIRIHTDAAGNEKALAQYLQLLQQFGVGKVEQHTERFLRLSTLIVVEASLRTSSAAADGGKSAMNYNVIDVYSKLLLLLFRHMNTGENADQIKAQRLGMLNKILGVIVRTMMWDYEKKSNGGGSKWDQRPWFRLLLNLVIDMNKPDPAFDPIRLGILSVFGAAFHVTQPLVMPGECNFAAAVVYTQFLVNCLNFCVVFVSKNTAFAFSWLELVSHRHFLPNVLLVPGQKGWNIAHQLLIDYFLFLEPHMKRVEMTPPVKKLYEGTLRVLLVLLHDFPSFLAGYHLSFCNVIPDSCVQLRNLILSATPKGMMPPDPFTPNLKIDLLPEISQSPVILSNVLGPIESFRGHLDAYLKDSQRRNFLAGLPSLLYKEGTNEVDAPMVNSLVLYVGIHALARLQNTQIALARTPEMEVLQKLMELDDYGRYVCLNAIANQLRFPSCHTHYFSCVMLFLFSESKNVAVKEQVTRVLLERLILHRPHPWGLLITFIELIKNQRYEFWNYPFTRCATEIEKVFESVARSCMPPGSSRITVGDGAED